MEEKLYLVLIIIIGIVIYLFITDCIMKKKETFNNRFKGYKLDRSKIRDIQTGGYFGEVNKDNSNNDVPVRAMSSEEKTKFKKISNMVLRKLNKMLGLKFETVDLEFISYKPKKDGNVRVLLEVFTWEKLNHYNRRLILDLTLDYQIKKVIVNNLMLANAKNIKEEHKHEEYYFHQPILSDDNMKKDFNIYGSSDSKLAFGKLDYVNEYINHKNFNKWILPQQYLEKINSSSMVWPCRKEEFSWDTAGVNVVEDETNQCQGINSSYQKKQYIPKFDGSFKSVNYDSEHNWLFGKHKGDGRNIFMGGAN